MTVEASEVAMCGILQGALIVRVTDLVSAESGIFTQPVRVEQPTIGGTYTPYFLVHFASGLVVRISVETNQ